MRNTGIWAVAACLGALAVGCGDSESEKKSDAEKSTGAPKTVAAWASEFQKAAKAGDCKALKTVAPYLGCEVKDALGGARVAGSKQYGTGAVVDFEGASYPKQSSEGAQVVLVEQAKEGWIAVLDVPDSQPEVGTKPPASIEPFEDAAAKWIGGVAEGDCKTAFKYAAVNEAESTYCKNVIEQQRAVLGANPFTTPEPLGGTANIQFLRYTLTVPKSVDPKGRTSYATLPVLHVSKRALAQGATNPYLVAQPIPAPTPADVAAEGPYTKAVRDRYVENSAGDGTSREQATCEIEMIAAGVPYPDFKTPTERFDKALPGVKRACKESLKRGTVDEQKVARIALGGDLVPGFICSPDVSTDKVVKKLGGTRHACAAGSGEAPPDNTVELKEVSVQGESATVKGTDEAGNFTVRFVRQGPDWLVDDFANSGG